MGGVVPLLLVLGAAEAAVVLVAVDGLGDSALRRLRSDHIALPGFDRLRAEGVEADYLLPLFPTTPAPNLHTLVTGVSPSVHGISGEFMLGKDGSAVASPAWWNRSEALWTQAAAVGLKTASWWPACDASVGGAGSSCRGGGVSVASASALIPDLLHELSSKDLSLGLLRLQGLREAGREWGPQSGTAKEALSSIDTFLYKLQDGLAATGVSVNLIVVGLGGQAQILPHNLYFLDDFVDLSLVHRLLLNDAFLQIFPEPGKDHQVYTSLAGVVPSSRVMWRAQSPARLGLRDAGGLAPLLLLPEPGFAVYARKQAKQIPRLELEASDFPFPKGLGGYDNADEEMKGVFLASGPDFPRGKTHDWLDMRDVYWLIRSLLGLPGAPSSPRLAGLASAATQTLHCALLTAAALLTILIAR